MAIEIRGLSGWMDALTAAAAPYVIKGDTVTAFIAQVNRFANKTVKVGSTCPARKYVGVAFPLVTTLSEAVADAGTAILYDFAACQSVDLYDQKTVDQILRGRQDVLPYVLRNIDQFTMTLAQLGDSLGFDPASTGITTRDPSVTPQSRKAYYIGGTILLLTGLAAYLHRRGK